MWRKISAFSRPDPAVLDFDNNHHIQKAKEAKYGYLIDYTAARLARSQDCDLAAIDDRFNFMHPYCVAFPRNSVLKDLFNEV